MLEKGSTTTTSVGFRILGKEHLLILMMLLLSGYLLMGLLPEFSEQTVQLNIGKGMSWILCLTVLAWTYTRGKSGNFDIRKDMPLDICNLSSLLMPLLMYSQNEIMFQLMFYWILAGTLQAVLTPDLDEPYPHITYFKYWLVHGGLVIAILYATLVMGMKPSYTGLWYAFSGIQLYALSIYLFNRFTGANYAYLSRKPENPTLLDHLGKFPYYILSLEVLALILFHLLYYSFTTLI